MAALSEMPKEWDRELWIAVAGPFASLVVAVGCPGVVAAVPIGEPVVVFVVGWLAVTNFVLVGFNLLPAFPMDGGRVLRALLARRGSHADATRTAARDGVRVDRTTPAFDALTQFDRRGPGYVFVEHDGEITGIMSERSVGHVLALQQGGVDTGRAVEPF